MPLLLLAMPALVATQAPGAAPSFDPFQEQLEAIPAALIDGKRGAMPALMAKAVAGWEQTKPAARKAMSEAEVAFIDKQLKAMQKMKPLEQALGALGISSTISRFQSRGQKQDLLQAGRLVMSAWCGVDAGQWEPFPNVADGFKPLIAQDNGRHTVAVLSVQDALKRLQESQTKRQTLPAKKALKDLLGLVDVLRKS